MRPPTSYKVLVLSRNYPNSVTPVLGLWVEGLVQSVGKICEVRVVAPTPYCPPLPGVPQFTKFRTVERQRNQNGIDVLHPRFLIGPGYSLYNLESNLYYWSIRSQIDRLRRKFPFDLIHANFVYPDGVVAARLSRRYQVPFVITEHASWIPWMDNYPQVREKAVWAADKSSFHIAVSRFARATIAHFTGDSEKLKIIPNGVDTSIFKLSENGNKPRLNQILFVGLMRHVKGIDVLLKALQKLIKHNAQLKLVLVGGGINRNYDEHEKQLRKMSVELGLENNIEFAGIKKPLEVARYMRESAVLVLPSRTETFGAVLIEALACGTPVVATRCGGPEDIVHEGVGKLVPKENPDALAQAIIEVIAEREKYDPKMLRDYVLNNFTWEDVARQTVELYGKAVNVG